MTSIQRINTQIEMVHRKFYLQQYTRLQEEPLKKRSQKERERKKKESQETLDEVGVRERLNLP